MSAAGSAGGPTRVAAVDVGTNSTRLLVADWDGERLVRRMARSRVTRLGRGVDATVALSEEGMLATLSCMLDYRDEIAFCGVERTFAVATCAVREAVNAQDFLARAAEAGVPLRVLTAEDEARFAFAGATRDLGPGEHALIDVGGGSTELAVGSDGLARSVVSLPLGCVRVSERYLSHDPPQAGELASLADEVRRAAEATMADLGPMPKEAAATGGTATTLGAISRGLDAYDDAIVDRTTIDAPGLAALRDRLASMTVADISAMPVVQAGRADVLVGGAALLVAAVETLGLERLLVRDRDILDGLALAAATG